MRDLSFIKSWEEAAELGRTWREAGDEARFELGDLACFVCVRREGRPLAGADGKTLTEFAKEIGEHRPAVSQMAAMSEFLSDDDERLRCFEMGVGWHSLNAARIRTGWKPGEPVGKRQAELFWHVVTTEADGGARAPRAPEDDLRRTLADVRRLQSKLGDVAKRDYLPGDTYTGLATAHDALTLAIEAMEKVVDDVNSGKSPKKGQCTSSLDGEFEFMFAEGERVTI